MNDLNSQDREPELTEPRAKAPPPRPAPDPDDEEDAAPPQQEPYPIEALTLKRADGTAKYAKNAKEQDLGNKWMPTRTASWASSSSPFAYFAYFAV